MSKTQLLIDIEKSATEISNSMHGLADKLMKCTDLTNEHYVALTKFGTDLDKLGVLIGKMKAKIAGWEKDKKLLEKIKIKKPLSVSKDEAKKKFALLETDYKELIGYRTDFIELLAYLREQQGL